MKIENSLMNYIHSNREGGRGRYDLVVEPMDKSKNGLVIEFKVAKEKEI